jgi:formylglycine-generating enzyme required for sulfatase activity
MLTEPAKPLRIFLSYAHADVVSVRKLHRYLREKGFDVWFDKENLMPGHDWRLEIEDGLNNSDVVIVCLSQISVSKEGFVQREFKFALDRTLDMPDGRVFLIPVRLDNCKVPTRLSRYHWVDLFEREGYPRLLRGLKHCAEQLARARVDESQPVSSIPALDANFGAPPSQAQDEATKREKQTAEDERQAREDAEAQRIAQKQADQERIAREKNERQQRARALFFGGLLLVGVGILAIWLLGQAFPAKPTPTATLLASATATTTFTPAPPTTTLTPVPPTNIPVTFTPSLTPTLVAGVVTTSPKDGMKLHYVPAGSFKMGSNNDQADEKPAHQITLDAFWIDETEVTNKMYAICVKDTECQPPSSKDSSTHKPYYDNSQFADYPVINVSWNDASAYCSWAGRKLPNEAQWEKAARGPNGNIYPWGDAAPDNNLLNYNDNAGDTSKVGSYPNGKSFYGAYDMAGNVWEWVNDWYDVYPGGDPHATIRFGQTYGVLRGGSWSVDNYYVRSSYRFYYYRIKSALDFGFRCALTP